MDYRHIEGLAKIGKELKTGEVDAWVEDKGGLNGNCEYCGARIRYVYHFTNGEKEIGVGSCCASNILRYMDMPDDKLQMALDFFAKYRDLARKVGVEGYKVSLKEIDAEIRRLKEEIKKKKERLFGENLEWMLEMRGSLYLTRWEYGFLETILAEEKITEKQLNLMREIKERIKNRDESWAWLGAVYDMSRKEYGILPVWLHNIIGDMYLRDYPYLSEKQKKLVELGKSIIQKKNPKLFEEWSEKVRR